MSMLLVLVFDTEFGANEMVDQVQAFQRQQVLIVSDAAIVIRKMDEKVKVKQVNSLVGSGMWGGAFWGLLVGLLFGQPLLSSVPTSSVTGSMSDYSCGLHDDFIQEVRRAIKPGTSALFLMIAYMLEERVLSQLSEQNANQLCIILSSADETILRDAFGVVEGY